MVSVISGSAVTAGFRSSSPMERVTYWKKRCQRYTFNGKDEHVRNVNYVPVTDICRYHPEQLFIFLYLSLSYDKADKMHICLITLVKDNFDETKMDSFVKQDKPKYLVFNTMVMISIYKNLFLVSRKATLRKLVMNSIFTFVC